MSRKIINFETLDFQSVTTALAETRNVTQKQVTSILNGTIDSREIKTYEQYQSINKLRHDAIHWMICQHREIPFGERAIDSFQLRLSVKEHKYYKLIKDQTPDIIIIDGNHIKISELTVSRMKYADIPKITKYRLLVDILKQSGYDVDLEVIVINSAFSMPDREFLMTEYKFTENLIDTIYQIIENTDSVMYQIHETDQGAEWLAKSRGLILEDVNFHIEDDEILNLFDNSEAKPFIDREDLKQVLNSNESNQLSQSDDEFINLLVDEANTIKCSMTRNQSCDAKIKELIEFHQKNSTKYFDDDIRSFMPLPYFEQNMIDSAVRSTLGDIDLLTALKGKLSKCSDPFLVKLSTLEGSSGRLKLSPEIKYGIALEGPGRRKYTQAGSIPHLKESQRWDKHWIPIFQDFNHHINDISFQLSQVSRNVDDVMSISGLGLNYVKICQSIFREVCINALRKERRREYILKPTGIEGAFVVLFPGPKLRTGENLSIIWFKVILIKDLFKYDSNLSKSWIFKKLLVESDVYHSKWLSTDANRLDHYLRCYDKIFMAYSCYSSLSRESLKLTMTRNDNNTLGIIIMIYMEDKRSTSKMLQDVRYLIMTCLSMFNYYSDVLDKFKDPIRTPLQSYLLTKILSYPRNPEVRDSVLSSDFGKLNVEAGTGDSFDKWSGADINLPRILTDGPIITFKQMLCEMYFTMLFNKNQDDPTHASFQILSKILEGEENLKWVKSNTKLHVGLRYDDVTDAKTLISTKHKNQFSRRAIMIGSKLQSVSEFNKANSGVAHKLASQSVYIDKYLDEFATFKSSSTFVNPEYKGDVYNSFRLANREEYKKVKISDEKGMQNPRRRCIEGVDELMSKGYMTSFDLVKNHIFQPLRFQVFKKNQIGGVREILILDIYKRVLVNILESFSRVICNDDDREMLTHGDKKFTLMRDMIRQLKRGEGKKLVMNYNFDKTKWAPSFMPIQFLYMFVPFKRYYPSLFKFIVTSLIIHTNKEFILPEKLIRVWRNDLNNNLQHLMDPNLQKLKELFLSNGKKLSYLNESNMGQGILHYTSSYFHLCVISLRDEVFKRLCKKNNISPGSWRDIVSSDDSYTAHALPLDSKNLVRLRVILFMKAQEVVERVMNVWTSSSKSSISLLIYEFNSLFGANLTMFPTTFKFALASVHPVNTDSFFRMVKESYISCRQIVENGGSLELYMIASRLNKQYCESIYHTNVNGVNAPEKFLLRREFSPYQLGIYPISDPAMMIMFGPEHHNYDIILRKDSMTREESRVFSSMHTLVESDDPELYSAMGSLEDVMVGVNRIEAKIGPIRRLEQIKKKISLTWDDLKLLLVKDPLLLFNKPNGMLELKAKVYMKLFRNGASEALRTTAASIYYGRVSASVSAEAFYIPFVSEGKKTYHECVNLLINSVGSMISLDLLYPHLEEYKTIKQLSYLEFEYSVRSALETQNIRLLQLNRLQQRMNNSVVDVLNHYWGRSVKENPPTSYIRDWINLQDMVPIIQSTMQQTLDQFPGDEDRKVRSLLLIILRLMSHGSKPMKAIVFGPSSRSYDSSYLSLKQQNMFTNATSTESKGVYMTQNITKVTDKLAFAFNYFALSVITSHNKRIIDVSHLLDDSEIESFFMDNTMSSASYKKVLMMLLYHGKIDDVTPWSRKTHTIFHKWIMRSESKETSYYGDYVLKLQLADVVLQVSYSEQPNQHIKLSINKVHNMVFIKELIDRAIELTGLDRDRFFRIIDRGSFYMTNDTVVTLPNDSGFKIFISSLQSLKYRAERIVWKDGFFALYDLEGQLILQTVEGLLSTDYIPTTDELKEELFIDGIKLSELVMIRPFNIHFSVQHISPSDLIKLLHSDRVPSKEDLEVSKPVVTDITNKRLGINYPLRTMELEFSEIKVEESTIDTDDIDMSDEAFMQQILMPSDEILEIFNNQTSQTNFHDVWMDPNFDINLIKTMTKQIITYQPKKILERTINIKYQIIASLVTNVNILNKATIESAHKLLNNKNITYSLIYTYDKQYSNLDAPSPSGFEIKIDSGFQKYYCDEHKPNLDSI